MNRQYTLETLLKDAFTVEYIELVNESHMHSVPANSETHFKLTLVSPDFSDLSRVARHQRVYAQVLPLMEQGLHALALHLFTPQEWLTKQGSVPASPNCMGGSKQAAQ